MGTGVLGESLDQNEAVSSIDRSRTCDCGAISYRVIISFLLRYSIPGAAFPFSCSLSHKWLSLSLCVHILRSKKFFRAACCTDAKKELRAKIISLNSAKYYLADRLVALKVINDVGQETLNGGQLSALRRDFKVNLGDLDCGGIGLDELTVEISLVGDLAGVDGASNSDGVGLLELVRAVSAVGAVESHQDDLTEVRHTGQQKASGALYMLCSIHVS